MLLYISVLVPGLAAIHFCSGAGACCYTLLALVSGLAAIHFYSGAGACCYTFLMLWDVFGAHVVGRVRGLCCGTCSGPMLWDDDFAERTRHLECDHDCIQAYVVGRVRGPCCGMTCPTQSPTRTEGVPHSHEKSYIFHVIRSYYDWGRTSVEFPNHMKNLRFFM